MTLRELYRDFYPQKPLYVQSFREWLRLSRWAVYLRFRARMFWRMFIKGGIRELGGTSYEAVRDWNKTKTYWSSPFARRRSEHLIYLLRAIPLVHADSKILCIGPRNEGELLLLRAHGFKDVQGIDLYSYSPDITLMDMHKMWFSDDTFDVLISSYTVRYSHDFIQCSKEMVRVCKPGGIMAISFSQWDQPGIGYDRSLRNVPSVIGTSFYGGTKELQAYFMPHLKHVYWQMDDDDVDESELPRRSHTTIFSVKK